MRKVHITVLFMLLVPFLSLLTLTSLAGAAVPLHHASGGGFYEVINQGGLTIKRMFAFNAFPLNEDGDAKGQFEQHNLTTGRVLHMKIIYMEFGAEGSNVWLVGEVTKSNDPRADIGDKRAVKLQDNGEGANSPLDMRSKLSAHFTYPFPPLSEQEFALVPLDGGNIQIR